MYCNYKKNHYTRGNDTTSVVYTLRNYYEISDQKRLIKILREEWGR